jgi:flagellar biosynthesis protein FlhG
MRDFAHSSPQPLDQADGLRRLFGGGTRTRFVAIASNPHVSFAGVMLERLTAAFATLGLRSLVVDAAETAPEPHELAALDLSACVQPVSSHVCYLAARGLPLRYVNAHGSCASFLQEVADAAQGTDVVVVHAPASDLCRLFAQRVLRPVLLAADQPASVTHAYAAMKLVSGRTGLMSYDLLLAADEQSPRRERIAQQLAGCADHFLGAVVRDWAAVDPASDVRDAPSASLLRLAHGLLRADDEQSPADVPAAAQLRAARSNLTPAWSQQASLARN